jgi:hypothetical protein
MTAVNISTVRTTTAHLPDPVAIWFDRGVPARLVWRGTRYVVTDTPTPLRERVDHAVMTHPLEAIVGWRFQGTAEGGQTYVFDVHGSHQQQWRLVAVYE